MESWVGPYVGRGMRRKMIANAGEAESVVIVYSTVQLAILDVRRAYKGYCYMRRSIMSLWDGLTSACRTHLLVTWPRSIGQAAAANAAATAAGVDVWRL